MASLSSRFLGAAGLPALVVLLTLPWRAAAGERELTAFWGLHLAATNDADPAVADALARYEAAQPSDPYLPVARSIAAWHLLRTGRTADAMPLLEKLAAATNAGPCAQAAGPLALRWLTRMDQVRVRQALTDYYAAHVRFPDALGDLPPAGGRPLTDRWGKPWEYRLMSFAKVPGLTGQRYALASASLGDTSDLTAMLARPYAATIRLTPQRMMPGGEGHAAVLFRTLDPPGQDVVLTEGTDYHGIALVSVGSSALILCDGDYWLVLPRPQKEE